MLWDAGKIFENLHKYILFFSVWVSGKGVNNSRDIEDTLFDECKSTYSCNVIFSAHRNSDYEITIFEIR